MNALRGWIKRHQVAAFFIISFAITWPVFILVFFVFPGNQFVQVLTGGLFGAFSPALAAMLISAIVEPQPKRPSSKPRWIAFGVAWLCLASTTEALSGDSFDWDRLFLLGSERRAKIRARDRVFGKNSVSPVYAHRPFICHSHTASRDFSCIRVHSWMACA